MMFPKLEGTESQVTEALWVPLGMVHEVEALSLVKLFMLERKIRLS